MRKAALEWKYGLKDVSDDPVPLINYMDVRMIIATLFVHESADQQIRQYTSHVCFSTRLTKFFFNF